MSLPIAVQLYSVREDASKDLYGVLKQVKQMGYDGVEFAGYYGNSPTQIRVWLDEIGLKAEGTHTAIEHFDDDKIGQTVEDHHTLGAKFAIIPWLPESMRDSAEAAMATAERFTKISEALRPHGLLTGFHAHDGDMLTLPGGKSAWDIIAANTPEDFIMQYDTANGLSGGADPIKPILDWPGRAKSLHIKADEANLVGEGVIDWKRAIEASTVGGSEWLVIEHEDSSRMPSLEAIDLCLKNLKTVIGE